MMQNDEMMQEGALTSFASYDLQDAAKKVSALDFFGSFLRNHLKFQSEILPTYLVIQRIHWWCHQSVSYCILKLSELQ